MDKANLASLWVAPFLILAFSPFFYGLATAYWLMKQDVFVQQQAWIGLKTWAIIQATGVAVTILLHVAKWVMK